ncbi:hypothetical protein EW026_g3894 [Hermanssonia centrifuga]|uniref:Uncharacterized protein n=1 Tax=Hermanssonia centrifuga TaxID=98765 RepID=A0A4S4KK19_9APHY|nr:hypothetical protein EW026_g3894 [Hermanssonia centrifuga]
MILNMGGDDITEFLYVLLQKINFPYRELDLARAYDWNVIEDLKGRLCTLAEGDVALNLYDFVVRRPGKPTEKYGLRAYDETILAPMCLFEPRVIEFDQKRAGCRPFSLPDVTDEIVEQTADHVTQAMMISTQHLLPSAIPIPTVVPELPPVAQIEAAGVGEPSTNGVAPEPVPMDPAADPAPAPHPDAMDITMDSVELKEDTAPVTSTESAAAGAAPIEVIDVDDGDVKPVITAASSEPQIFQIPVQLPQHHQSYPGGFAIDVCFEASKLPLDVAIFNSARAAGGDEKIRKYLQAVLITGGSALVPGMAHALESRLQAIATPLVPNMEKVQIIPPPKDVDPWALAWKGAAVLGKMDGVSDLWITAADWDIFGMRGLKERCFYL